MSQVRLVCARAIFHMHARGDCAREKCTAYLMISSVCILFVHILRPFPFIRFFHMHFDWFVFFVSFLYFVIVIVIFCYFA